MTWATDDGKFRSSAAYGLTANGAVDLQSTPAGAATVKLSGGVLPGGDRVTGAWAIQLGQSNLIRTLVPDPPSVGSRTVHVELPNELPIPGARVEVSGLKPQLKVGKFTYTSTNFQQSGLTNETGDFAATGYAPGNQTATVEYDDGVLVQTVPDVALTGATTTVTLEEMPWLETSQDTFTADADEVVAIPIDLGTSAGRPSAQMRTGASAQVTIVPPSGASQKVCKSKLTGRTDAKGHVVLKVCASKSGTYRIKGSGAAATSAVVIRVRKASPMPVTAATGTSPKLGQARIAWNPPAYTGGAPVKWYTVALTLGHKVVSKRVTGRTVTFAGLKHATTYTAMVTATTKYGTSDPVRFQVPVA